jgi:hypothetical protein
VITAAAFALMGGWFLLEESLISSAGLRDMPLDEIRDNVADLIALMIEQGSGTGPGRDSSPSS